MSTVYHVRNAPPDAVYIGRRSVRGPLKLGESPWANPYRIGPDGTREEVLARFETYARERLQSEPGWLEPLRGKDLACWCHPASCHGDVILKLLEEPQA